MSWSASCRDVYCIIHWLGRFVKRVLKKLNTNFSKPIDSRKKLCYDLCNGLNTEQEEERMATRLRELREEKNMTQEELAEKSGVSRAIIWRLERDDNHNATTKTLHKLAVALGVPVDAFFVDKMCN